MGISKEYDRYHTTYIIVIIFVAGIFMIGDIMYAEAQYNPENYLNSITFDRPESLDGDAGIGCIQLGRGGHTKWEDNSTLVHMARLGIGPTQVMFGTQTPQWYYICKFNDRDYFLPIGDSLFAGTDMIEIQSVLQSDSLSSRERKWIPKTAIGPVSWNPFELVGPSTGFSDLGVRTDKGNFQINIDSFAAMNEMEFLPHDDVLKVKMYGVNTERVSFQVRIPYELAMFDWDKYDGNILVNGVITPASFTTVLPPNKYDVMIVIKDENVSMKIDDIKDDMHDKIKETTQATIYVKKHAWDDLNIGDHMINSWLESPTMYKKWYTIKPGVETQDYISEYKHMFRDIVHYMYEGGEVYIEIPRLYKKSEWNSHNTSMIINDIIANMAYTSKYNGTLVILIDIDRTEHVENRVHKNMGYTMAGVVYMSDHGWPKIDDHNHIHNKTKRWYMELYGDYLAKYDGKMPDSDIIDGYAKKYHDRVTYYDAVLDIEIPLIIKDTI